MNINIKKIDIKVVIAVILFAITAILYFYCNSTITEKRQRLEAENQGLQSEVDYLQELMNDKQKYIDDTEMMSADITRIIGEFPADIKPENQIVYVNDLELKNAIVVKDMSMPGKEIVSVITDEQNNAQNNAQPADDAAQEGEAQPVDDSSQVTPAGGSMSSTVALYRNPTTFSFDVTYKSVKEMLKSICEDTNNKKSIESVTLAIDEATRNLTGTMTIAMYSLDGTDKEYVAPSVIGVTQGTDNIFKSLDNVNLLRSTTTDKSAGVSDEGTETDDADKADDDEADDADDAEDVKNENE